MPIFFFFMKFAPKNLRCIHFFKLMNISVNWHDTSQACSLIKYKPYFSNELQKLNRQLQKYAGRLKQTANFWKHSTLWITAFFQVFTIELPSIYVLTFHTTKVEVWMDQQCLQRKVNLLSPLLTYIIAFSSTTYKHELIRLKTLLC